MHRPLRGSANLLPVPFFLLLSLYVTPSPNAGFPLFAAFNIASDRPSYRAAAWSRALTLPPYASLSNGHCRRTSHSLSLLDLPHLACLSPLALDCAASSALALSRRHLHDHASLLDSVASLFSPNALLSYRRLHGHSSHLGNTAALPLSHQRLRLRRLFANATTWSPPPSTPLPLPGRHRDSPSNAQPRH
jgi:hypothetical protein